MLGGYATASRTPKTSRTPRQGLLCTNDVVPKNIQWVNRQHMVVCLPRTDMLPAFPDGGSHSRSRG